MGLDKLIGMRNLKARARIDIAACKKTREPFPHTLIDGLGGCGKSALAHAIAEELHYHQVKVEASALKKREDIIERLISAHEEAHCKNKKLLLFIDEVHRLSSPLQEVFYFPLDREQPHITTATGVTLLHPFTLVAATTRRDVLDQSSFVRRFGNIWRVSRFDIDDIVKIVYDYMRRNQIKASYECCRFIATRSLGIPRQAIRLSERVRNVFLAHNCQRLTTETCELAIKLEGIDPIGLDELSVHYLKILAQFSEPRGLGSLAGRLGEQKETLENMIEPVLLELGLIDRASRGRMITSDGLKHLEQYH